MNDQISQMTKLNYKTNQLNKIEIQLSNCKNGLPNS